MHAFIHIYQKLQKISENKYVKNSKKRKYDLREIYFNFFVTFVTPVTQYGCPFSVYDYYMNATRIKSVYTSYI
jgi:hypothetical protein